MTVFVTDGNVVFRVIVQDPLPTIPTIVQPLIVVKPLVVVIDVPVSVLVMMIPDLRCLFKDAFIDVSLLA